MSSFTDPLLLEDLGDRTFRLTSPFRYEVGSPGGGEIITVPAGFITDFASIPQIFWNILPPFGQYGKAAVVHDALYQTHGFWGTYSRQRSDEILLEAMTTLGVNWLTRRLIYRGVRLGGWATWRKTKEQRRQGIWEKTDLDRHEVVRAPAPKISPP